MRIKVKIEKRDAIARKIEVFTENDELLNHVNEVELRYEYDQGKVCPKLFLVIMNPIVEFVE